MLGPQGAPSEKRESDPDKVTSFEPHATPGMNWLGVIAGAGMAIVAGWLAVGGDGSVVSRLFLGVGAAFFAYSALASAKRANGRRPAGFNAEGLWIDGPRSRKQIAWNNIENLSVRSVARQEFNVVTLKVPARLIDQYSPDEARVAVRHENIQNALASAFGLRPARMAASLDEMFADRRREWGGEIWLTAHDRDRDAPAFGALIAAWWRRYRD